MGVDTSLKFSSGSIMPQINSMGQAISYVPLLTLTDFFSVFCALIFIVTLPLFPARDEPFISLPSSV